MSPFKCTLRTASCLVLRSKQSRCTTMQVRSALCSLILPNFLQDRAQTSCRALFRAPVGVSITVFACIWSPNLGHASARNILLISGARLRRVHLSFSLPKMYLALTAKRLLAVQACNQLAASSRYTRRQACCHPVLALLVASRWSGLISQPHRCVAADC